MTKSKNKDFDLLQQQVQKLVIAAYKHEQNYHTPPLNFASSKGYLEVVQYLISQGEKIDVVHDQFQGSPLHCAAKNGHIEIVQYLISQGAKIDVDTNYGTPLHRAAESGQVGVVQFLLSSGVKVNYTGKCDNSALMYAARNGHINVIKCLLAYGASVDASFEHRSPLYEASKNGHLEVVQLLISQGVKGNQIKQYGVASLKGAAENGHLEVVQYLIEEGVKVDEMKWDSPALMYAARNGHLNVVKCLLDSGASIDKSLKMDCHTPLYEAVRCKKIEVVDYLISRGANISYAIHYAVKQGNLQVLKFFEDKISFAKMSFTNKDRTIYTSILHIAVSSKQLEIVKYLVSQGADISKENCNTKTPLDVAISDSKADNLDIISCLIEVKAQISSKYIPNTDSTLHFAVKNGYLTAVEYLLELGINVDIAGDSCNTALHYASQHGHFEIAQLLVSHNANISALNKFGQTPLYISAENGHLNIVKFLILQEVDINQCDARGFTPLHNAALHDKLDVVELLISQGAKINPTIKPKWNYSKKYYATPLHWAASNGNLTAAQYFIEQGIDVNYGCQNPLYLAAENGHLNIVKFLIYKGAKINLKNSYLDVIHVAACNGHLEIVKYLVSHGENVDKINKNSSQNNTPMYYAAQEMHIEVVKYLISQGAKIRLDMFRSDKHEIILQDEYILRAIVKSQILSVDNIIIYHKCYKTILQTATNHFDIMMKLIKNSVQQHIFFQSHINNFNSSNCIDKSNNEFFLSILRKITSHDNLINKITGGANKLREDEWHKLNFINKIIRFKDIIKYNFDPRHHDKITYDNISDAYNVIRIFGIKHLFAYNKIQILGYFLPEEYLQWRGGSDNNAETKAREYMQLSAVFNAKINSQINMQISSDTEQHQVTPVQVDSEQGASEQRTSVSNAEDIYEESKEEHLVTHANMYDQIHYTFDYNPYF